MPIIPTKLAKAASMIQGYQGTDMIEPHVEPQKTFDEWKETYYDFVKNAFNTAMSKAVVEVAEGVTVNASRQAFSDVQGLLLTTLAGTEVQFRDAEDNYHTVDREDIEGILAKIAEKHQDMRRQKWELDKQVSEATEEGQLHRMNIVIQ